MSRKSKYTGGFRLKNIYRIPFLMLCLMISEKSILELFWFPSTLAVTPIMKEHFPGDYKGYIASSKCWEEIKHLQKK